MSAFKNIAMFRIYIYIKSYTAAQGVSDKSLIVAICQLCGLTLTQSKTNQNNRQMIDSITVKKV